MNKRLALIPIAGLALLTVVGCASSPNATSANYRAAGNATASSTASPSVANTVSASSDTSNVNTASTASASTSSSTKTASAPAAKTSVHAVSESSVNASEIAVIKSKGYSVNRTSPNASVQTSSGETLTAWIGTLASNGDGYNHYVFFFLNGKYLGTDTAKPSLQITSAAAAGTDSIDVTYPVYKSGDSFANPTGAPVTITYTWTGSKLVPNKAYPTQFSAPADSANYKSEITVIAGKGYKPNGTVPVYTTTTDGKILDAWVSTLDANGDGHNHFVFFFLNGKYLGTDTATPSLQISSAKAAGTGAIAVTYPVYKSSDSFANPTGTPVTITYTWNGSKLVPNHSYPKQFS